MTSKEQYQKSLNKIVRSSCPNCYDDNGCSSCNIKECCNAPAKYWVDTLQKLIDQQSNPTLSECIKEWNETFNCSIGNNYDSFEIIGREFAVSINKKTLDFTIYGEDEYPAYMSYEEFNLLSKTLKALEEMKNE